MFEKDILSARIELDQKLHHTYYYYLYNHLLKHSQNINVQQKSMIENLRQHGIDNFGKLKNVAESNSLTQLCCVLFQILNSFPSHCRLIMQRSKKEYKEIEEAQVLIDYNKWRNYNQLLTKELRLRLQQDVIIEKKVEILNNKFNMLDNVKLDNPFITEKNDTRYIAANIQYKILHNIYPKIKHLHTWKIKKTPNCAHCLTPETIMLSGNAQ
jgi:hypothetical protein